MENLAPTGFRIADCPVLATELPVPTYCLEYYKSMLLYVTAYLKLTFFTPVAITRPTQSNSTLAAMVFDYTRRRSEGNWQMLEPSDTTNTEL